MSIAGVPIPDVKVFAVKRHQDDRGFLSETYNRRTWESYGVTDDFVQDNQSLSRIPFTLRGLHMQAPPFAQAKLVRVVQGSIFDVCVDVRIGSPTYGKWLAATISAAEWNQIYIPVGFLHGFLTLEPDTQVLYKVSNFYDRASELGVVWNDPDLQIDWPHQGDVKLSEKDAVLPRLRDFASPFEYPAG